MANKDYVEHRYLVNDTMKQLYSTPLFDGMSEKNQGDLAKQVNDVHTAYLPDIIGSGGDGRNLSRLLMSCVLDGVNLGRMSAQREREQASLDRNPQLKAKVDKGKGKPQEPQKADDDLFIKGFQA